MKVSQCESPVLKHMPIGGRLGGGLKRAIKRYFDFLIQENIVSENPIQDVKLQGAKQTKLYTLFSTEELDNLYKMWPLSPGSTTAIRNKVIIGLISYQGLTTTDISVLMVQDVDINSGILYVPQTRRKIKQIRTSVIVNWLKLFNLRQVQYMCGHRWISSTEAYKMNNIDQLTQDILKYHPF